MSLVEESLLNRNEKREKLTRCRYESIDLPEPFGILSDVKKL